MEPPKTEPYPLPKSPTTRACLEKCEEDKAKLQARVIELELILKSEALAMVSTMSPPCEPIGRGI